ncbi:carboxypeptidase-like regulatory domain-containing protein [Dyella lutea]|uniref:Carboxypeptidase-like regulatory domain-containing protein n=1 Tax=Dyella lutea TaxID=2950441 RepID=A0ABT1FEK2_9GAMM|nr:carboxypeptidase-like regulatory domain-containing protein [Dyella lutea]MCP1375814.1 carboxypeptidase-like regulatory domain-containing protein [Dyella lutea]
MNKTHANPARLARGARLVVVAALGLVASAAAFGQSTTGSVFGYAPPGDVVAAHSTTNGNQRKVHVQADGRYALRSLPAGVYNVTLEENGKAVLTHLKVPVVVGRGSKVDFDCTRGDCAKAADRS